jgi:hypothetical protein
MENTNNKNWNLDDSVREYFIFSVKGVEYKFRYPTTEEISSLQSISNEEDTKSGLAKLAEFISNVKEGDVSFTEMSKTLNTQHWANFRKMIQAEFIGED